MSVTSYFRSAFAIPRDKPALARAQIDIFVRQLPIMYGIIFVSMAAISVTYFQRAPVYLTIYVPALLAIVMIWRIYLFRRVRENADIESIYRRLRSIVIMAALMGTVFSTWSIALYPYGDQYGHGHLIFFMGITSFGCIASMMHFRPAAITLFLFTLVPACFLLQATGQPVVMAVGLNMLLVGGFIIVAISSFYDKFVQSIDDQQALIEKQAETQKLSDINSKLASLDTLTDLPNRRGFFAELEGKLSQKNAMPCGLVVGIMDLDGFKPINDIYGHPMGDKLLIQVAQRLRDRLPQSVYVARLGGDEFGLIFSPGALSDNIMADAERICAELRVPFNMDGFVAQITASLGMSEHRCLNETPETLFEQADYALYHAKEFQNGGAVLFSDAHAETIRQVNGIEKRLRDADLEEELFLAFQPIVDLQSNRVCGLEVLARWDNPVLGSIPPSTFIRAAERAGMINQLTEILFRKALTAAQTWPDDIVMSFNLSPYDIGAPECMLKLIGLFEKSGLSAKRLVFEVTETAVMLDFGRACDTLQNLKTMGAAIALDDFGTGYSSLSHVRQLPLDRLKVDRSFVNGLENDTAARSVMQTILDLCRNLDIECIVEGVETERQLEILTSMGCRYIQGYLFSRPMDADLVVKYLEADRSKLVDVVTL